MNYKSFWELNKETLVKKVLAEYQETGSVSAGYNILRYAVKGNIQTTENCYPQEPINWYSMNTNHTILRLAQEGKLEFKE
jgi:hypothetical protein